MRGSLALPLVLALWLSPASAKQPRCTLRLHCEANPHDGNLFATQLVSKFTGRPVVIEKTATITESDVVAFYPIAAGDGSFGALFQLDDHGRLALDMLSVERRGSNLFVFVNGRPITELQIDRRISDGKIYVPSGLTSGDIAAMQKQWRLIGEKRSKSQIPGSKEIPGSKSQPGRAF